MYIDILQRITEDSDIRFEIGAAVYLIIWKLCAVALMVAGA